MTSYTPLPTARLRKAYYNYIIDSYYQELLCERHAGMRYDDKAVRLATKYGRVHHCLVHPTRDLIFSRSRNPNLCAMCHPLIVRIDTLQDCAL